MFLYCLKIRMENTLITSDQELLIDVQNGNINAYTEFVRRYEKRIAATIIGMLGDCPEADDVGQETFIRFYKSINNFRGDSAVATYLTRIAINLSLNELKRRKRQDARSAPLSHAANEAVAANQDDLVDMKQHIHRSIQKLDGKFRSVVVLRLLEGYSTKETAKILKLPLGTVLSRLARAQDKLREMLSPYWGENHA